MSKPAQVMSREWGCALRGVAAGCFLATLIIWPTLVSLIKIWLSNQSYQFAWFVIPVMAYLLGWHLRATTLRIHPQPGFSGVLVAIMAATGWIASDLMNIDAGRQLTYILVVQGVCMAALGWRSYWRLFPILCLMFLMVPWGDLLLPFLRNLTVKVLEGFALVLHLPHKVNGFQITIAENEYVVLKECAGLSYFLLAAFLGYVFGLMLYRSIYRVLALAMFGALIGILSNALRVTGIVLVDLLRGSQMPLSAHGNIQWLTLIVCLGLFFLVLSRLKVDDGHPVGIVIQPDSEQPRRQWMPILAGFAVLLISAGATGFPEHGSSVRDITLPDTFPQSISGWKKTSSGVAWAVDPRAQTRSLSLSYQRDGEILHVQIVETMAAEAKLLDTDVAPGRLSQWYESSLNLEVVCVDALCMKLLHTIWENGQTEERQHVYSSYALGNTYTTSTFDLRAARGWARLRGCNSQARLFGLSTNSPAMPLAVKDYLVIVRSLQSALENDS